MLKMPAEKFSITLKLTHIKPRIKRSFIHHLKTAVEHSTCHTLKLDLLPADELRIGSLNGHDMVFTLGVIAGIAESMETGLKIDHIDLHAEAPTK